MSHGYDVDVFLRGPLLLSLLFDLIVKTSRYHESQWEKKVITLIVRINNHSSPFAKTSRLAHRTFFLPLYTRQEASYLACSRDDPDLSSYLAHLWISSGISVPFVPMRSGRDKTIQRLAEPIAS